MTGSDTTFDGLPTISTQDLADLAAEALRRWPGYRLVKNQVGNLTVWDGTNSVAYLDLRFGTIETF